MTEVDAILQQFAMFGIKLGLDSSLSLLERLGNPHQQVSVVHVAGSNGKGSVCAFLANALKVAGYRVGRYTSPHLIDWTERICLNGQPIASADLVAVLQEVVAAIPADTAASPTQFEVITAAAWLWFAQQQVDIAVMEVGLGGRLDATNVCDRPLVSVITTISREHWQRLGPTLANIAFEKAGILKPKCPAVVGHLPSEAMQVVKQRIAELDCPAVFPEIATDDGDGWVRSQNIRYQLPLSGEMQRHNSALAIAALKILQQQGWSLSDEMIAEGIAQTEWAGRMQWFTWQGQQFLIDGAHNPAGAAVLRQYVDQVLAQTLTWQPPVTWVLGMMRNKDHQEVLEALLRPGDRLLLVPVPDPSTAEPEKLASLAQTVCPELAECQVLGDVFQALPLALEQSAPNHLTVLCGSLYLLGYFFRKVQASTGA